MHACFLIRMYVLMYERNARVVDWMNGQTNRQIGRQKCQEAEEKEDKNKRREEKKKEKKKRKEKKEEKAKKGKEKGRK